MKQTAERGDKEILSSILLQIFFVTDYYRKLKNSKGVMVMNKIKISLDKQRFQVKPTDKHAAAISKRIAKQVQELHSTDDIAKFVSLVGNQGCTFSPATFVNGIRRREHFEQIQILVLDFDGGISYEEVMERADKYQLPVLAVYETFTSKNKNRFRVLFINNASITNIISAKILKNALMMIFPETDKTDSDVVKMYYGGKKVLYFNQLIKTIDMEKVLRNMTCYLRDRYGTTHYKRYIKKLAESNGIRLNKNGYLDISEIRENIGDIKVGKISPSTIIYSTSNGDFLPLNYYQLHLVDDGTNSCSLDQKQSQNHKNYRADDIKYILDRCRLFNEFETGIRELHHNELFGIANNLINAETGAKRFIKILEKHPEYYSKDEIDRWHSHLKFGKENGYLPMHCDKYCPYYDKCDHGTNILATVKVKRGTISRLANYQEEYYLIEEVQQDLEEALKRAVDAEDTRWYIIKAQTSMGKTETYLNMMQSSEKRFLIVVPTNKLKQDVRRRAKEKGIDVMITPSLDEIKDEIPDHIWQQIQFLRSTGQHVRMHLYINEVAFEEHVDCLQKYLKQLYRFEKYEGNVITTHRKLLTMNKKELNKYDVVIIDEDIISSSIITNQCEIPITTLKKVLKKVLKKIEQGNDCIKYKSIVIKIRRLLKMSKEYTQIKLSGFEWDCEEEKEIKNEDMDDILALADIPSFCLSEYFIYRKASEEEHLSEDSIIFLKPWKFVEKKYIMVSATVDKDICEYCFGKQNLKFHECKQAKYTGILNQYYQKSMSRNVIDRNPDILKKIREWSGFEYMITFKKYSDDDEMYFGNAIGCDYLKGQDINVVGTPYQVDFVYKLLPFSLGIPVDEEAVMKPHLVVHNGYSFMFTTYGEDDEILRKFHFWLIESELEQAVGRARLLRCNCTVNLFSNFPLRQARMKEYEFEDI